MSKKGRITVIPTVIIIFTAVSLVAGWSWHGTPGYSIETGNHVVERAFYEEQSELMVEITGQIVRVLAVDADTPSVQWFQVRTPGGQHLLVAHDHGRGDPAPLSSRDEVTVRGRYVWTESGGTIYGTHRDNSLERRHGWVEINGEKYQ